MKVSVIVPVYNSAPYLLKCLDSILKQTYSFIEIILVDDGSTDESRKICDDYAKRDDRIKIIAKPHGGLVSTRKRGLQHATGEYVCWVDSDDWIEPEYIANFVQLQKESGADIVAVAHYHDIAEDSKLIKNGINPGIYETRDVLERALYTGEFYEYGINPHLVTKMFKTELIQYAESTIDNSIMAGEDAAATYVALIKSEKIMISELGGYHYLQHAKSMTKISVPDEVERINALICHLINQFSESGVYSYFANQLKMYKKYLLILRKIEVFDIKDDSQILRPYGGIKEGDKVAIYGAGVVGQMIFNYIHERTLIKVVTWVDRNYEKYIEDGYNVESPNRLGTAENIDCIIIASISRKVAKEIRMNLIMSGIVNQKIRWLTDEFMDEDIEI